MRKARHTRAKDHTIIIVAGLLSLLGVIVIYTISPVLNYGQLESQGSNYFLYRHLLNLGLAVLGFVVASRISIETWKKLLPLVISVTVISSLLLLIPATSLTVNGATRWVGFGSLSFQPAELLKFAIVIYLGLLLGSKSDKDLTDKQYFWTPLAVIMGIIAVFLVIVQRDLGTMIVVVMIVMGMLYFRGVTWRYLTSASVAIVAGGILSVLLFPHRLSRLATFLNPADDLQGAGYHIDQALTAIGSGGIFGLGLGRSVQVYGFLPEAENDSVFAIHGEIFGFVGTVVLLLVFGYLLWRILTIAESQTSVEARLVISGIFMWILSHVLINIGAMLSLMPLTGITLPFLSYGGTSLLMIMISLGIVYGQSQRNNSF